MRDRDDQTRQVLETWDGVAPAWEKYRERLFANMRHVSEWLVDAIDPQPGQTVLELAAGPGETGFLVAERLGPSGHVISTDLAPRMVEAAKHGAQARGLDNIEIRVMDAQRIDLPDDSVDAVLCRFGLMLMPDPASALSGARRVLRSGGRLAFAVWGPPDRNPWIAFVGATLMQLGHQPPGDPFAPGGMFSLSSMDTARELTLGAGFSDVRAEELPMLQRFDSFEDYWGFQSEVAGPIAALLRSLPPDELDRLVAALHEAAAPFRVDDGYAFPTMALGIAAT